jgi:hypothetical protein
MRPHPHNEIDDADSERIIYLGDVRRRRTSRRQSPDRHYLWVLCGVAGFAWFAWLIVLINLTPARFLTYLAFLAPLWLALATTGALAAYWFSMRRGLYPGLRECGRRGALLATVVVGNLAVVASHHWSLPLFAVTAAGAVLTDAAVTRRGRFTA